MRVPRSTTRPNSDDNSNDDDDVRLTRSQSRASASVESGYQPNPNPDRGRDGPSSSSSQPKAADTSVPAVAVGATAAGTPNVPFGVSLTLRNTGSVARDHLASERTFLAYVRTSLSFASAGVGPSSFLLPYLFLKKHMYSSCTAVSCLRE